MTRLALMIWLSSLLTQKSYQMQLYLIHVLIISILGIRLIYWNDLRLHDPHRYDLCYGDSRTRTYEICISFFSLTTLLMIVIRSKKKPD